MESVDEASRRILEANGFDEQTFEGLRARLRRGEINEDTNRIRGQVRAPQAGDLRPLPAYRSTVRAELVAEGREAIAAGEVGVAILAGGMATRFGGIVKAAAEVLDGASFLDLKLADIAELAADTGGRIPVYLMTSFATAAEIAAMAAAATSTNVPVKTFPQMVSLRVKPDGDLFLDREGKPSLYAPGHGDLPDALRQSGMLSDFVGGGGKYLMMSNVDNLGATVDPAIIATHQRSGSAMTVEVADKEPGVVGGAPARVDGKLEVVEGFRFPQSFDHDSIPYMSTNTFVFDAEALTDPCELSWFAVNKKVDGVPAVQFERLVGEVSHFVSTSVVHVPCQGHESRFLPAKDPAELDRRRPVIRAMLSERGIL